MRLIAKVTLTSASFSLVISRSGVKFNMPIVDLGVNLTLAT